MLVEPSAGAGFVGWRRTPAVWRATPGSVVLRSPRPQAGLRQADGTSVRLFGKETSVPGTPAGGICMELALPSPLGPGKELNLVVVGVYVGLVAPFPAAAPAGSPLRVLFKGDAAILVPYPVHKQSIKAGIGWRGGQGEEGEEEAVSVGGSLRVWLVCVMTRSVGCGAWLCTPCPCWSTLP